MNTICTLNDLIAYLYNDTPLLKTVEIQKTIDNNEEVAELYQDMIAISKALDELLIAPEKCVSESIMHYARITAPY